MLSKKDKVYKRVEWIEEAQKIQFDHNDYKTRTEPSPLLNDIREGRANKLKSQKGNKYV